MKPIYSRRQSKKCSMMFCSACGVQNDDGSMFCANCGSKFDVSSQQNTQIKFDQNQNTLSPPQYAHNQTYVQNSNLYQNQPPQYNVQQNYGNQSSNYGSQQYGQPYSQFPIEDSINPILYVLSFIIFPLGLVLYFSNKQQKPNSAKNLIITTIIGFFIFWIAPGL